VVVVGRLLIEDSRLAVYVLMSNEEQCMNVCKFQLNEYNKGILFQKYVIMCFLNER
jgi:hypothetical protein